MKEGTTTSFESIVLNGYFYTHTFCKWNVFMKANSFLYFNTETNTIDRIAVYVNGKEIK